MVLNNNGNENPSSSPNEDRYLERRRRLFEHPTTPPPAPLVEETPTPAPAIAETTPTNIPPQAFVLEDTPIRAAEDVPTEKRSEDSYEKSKRKLALRQWIAVAVLAAVAVATTTTLVNIAQNFFNRATETPASAFTPEPTDTAELPLLPAFTPTASPETPNAAATAESASPVVAQIDPSISRKVETSSDKELQALIDKYKNVSPRNVAIVKQKYDRYITLHVKSKKPDKLEEGKYFVVSDPDYAKKGLASSYFVIEGIDLGDGVYEYNIPGFVKDNKSSPDQLVSSWNIWNADGDFLTTDPENPTPFQQYYPKRGISRSNDYESSDKELNAPQNEFVAISIPYTPMEVPNLTPTATPETNSYWSPDNAERISRAVAQLMANREKS